jgi:hypothetical protein
MPEMLSEMVEMVEMVSEISPVMPLIVFSIPPISFVVAQEVIS